MSVQSVLVVVACSAVIECERNLISMEPKKKSNKFYWVHFFDLFDLNFVLDGLYLMVPATFLVQ